MYPLPIPLHLPIKHSILILGPHLGLSGHFLLPALQRGRAGHVVFLEGGVHGRDDAVDHAEAFALAALLVGGEAPGDFPVGRGGGLVGCDWGVRGSWGGV